MMKCKSCRLCYVRHTHICKHFSKKMTDYRRVMNKSEIILLLMSMTEKLLQMIRQQTDNMLMNLTLKLSHDVIKKQLAATSMQQNRAKT